MGVFFLYVGVFFLVEILWFSFLPVISINITVLAHSTRIQLIMAAIPWLLRSPVFVVAVVAHTLRIVTFLRVTTLIYLFSIYKVHKYIFLFSVFSFSSSTSYFSSCTDGPFSCNCICFVKYLIFNCRYWLISILFVSVNGPSPIFTGI